MGCSAPETEQDSEPANVNSLPSSLLHAVFAHLGPKDLCSVSATCVLWSKLTKDKASNVVWKRFYTSRWRVTGAAGEDVCWQTKYGSKMKQGNSWTGKYEHDSLYGHKAGIKSLKLLPSHGMLLSGSLDRTVRLWDLNYGMPVSISRPHGGTVRSVALDQHLVASGSSDNVVRLWHARNATAGASLLDPSAVSDAAALLQDTPDRLGLAEGLMEMDGPADSDAAPAGLLSAALSANSAGASSSSFMAQRGGVPLTHGPYSVVTGEADESLFDLSLPAQQLRGHIGPVTSLCLTDSCLYSGSWDYTVRCWRRGSWDCISVLKYQDWVWSVVARGGMLLVASGPEVHVHDLPTGQVVRKFQNLHEGNVSCLEGTYSGKLLTSGGADGLLMGHDLRMKEPSRVLWHHNAGVHGLSLEDPWLASAASDGTVVMHNLEQALPNNLHTGAAAGMPPSSSMPRRNLNCPGHGGGPMYCVDIAESWLAAGGESPTIRLWDFTKAAEAAARAAAARAARNTAKRAKQRKAAAAAGDSEKASKRGGRSSSSAGCKGWNNRGEGSGEGSAAVRDGSAGSSRAAAAGSAAAVGFVVNNNNNSSSSSSIGTAVGNSSAEVPASSSSKKAKGLLAVAAAAAKAAGSSAAASPGDQTVSRADRFHRMQHAHVARQQQQQQGVAGQMADQPRRETAGTVRAKQPSAGSHHKQGSCRNSNGYSGYGHSPKGAYAGCSSSPQYANSYSGYSSSPQQQQYHWQASQYSSSPQQHWYGASPPDRWQQHSSRRGRHHAGNHWQYQQRPASNSAHLNVGAERQSNARSSVRERAVSSQGESAVGMPIPCSPCHRPNTEQAAAAAAAVPMAAAGSASPAAAEAEVDSCRKGEFNPSASPGTADAGCSYRVPFSSSYPSASHAGPWLVTGSSPRYDVGATRDVSAGSGTAGASKSRLSGAAAVFHPGQDSLH